MSYADNIFKDMCKDILENGTDTKGEKVRPVWEDGAPAYTIKKFCVVNRYDLSKEFPALTLRKTAFKSCVDEMLWIWQKKSNLTEELNSKIWDSWTSPVASTDITYIKPNITKSFVETYKDDVDFEREVCGIGYYGEYKTEKILEYFGDELDRWVSIWEDIIKECASNKKDTPSICPSLQSCAGFLEYIIKNNNFKGFSLSELTIDKDYCVNNNYDCNSAMLLPKKYSDLLKEEEWYQKDGLYFFNKLSLAQYLKRTYALNFIVSDAKTGIDKVSDEIDKYINKCNNEVEIINHRVANEKGCYPRFLLDVNHSIGTAYGYQLGVKHKYKEGLFDQVDRVIYDLKNNPFSRRIMTSIYVHNDLHSMGLYPCAYSMTFNVTEKDGKLVLNGILNQRSQDVLAANNWNVVQYSVLLHMIAQVCDMQVGEFVHVIADAHIYDRHVDAINELLSREPLPAPTFWINPDIKDFYDFTVDDVKLIDYNTHPQIKNIPIAI
jgi:thymidylate synthase